VLVALETLMAEKMGRALLHDPTKGTGGWLLMKKIVVGTATGA
jgi:hypothetical protein